MKPIKIIVSVVGVVVLLGLIVIGLALVPAIQTWAVRKAVAGQPGITIELGRVAAGSGTTEISDLRITQDGIVISAKKITAKYSAWDFIAHKRVTLNEVMTEGLVVDMRHPTAAANILAAGETKPGEPVTAGTTSDGAKGSVDEKKPPFNGVLNNIQLPLDVQLTRLAVDGQALLPDERVVSFNLHGSDIVVGQDRGRLEWKVTFSDPKKDSPVSTGLMMGSLGLSLSADRRLTSFEIQNEVSAEGANLPTDRVKIELKGAQPATGGDEHYTVSIALIRAEKMEPLLNARVDYQSAAHQLAGSWDLAVRSEQLATLLASFGLPEVTLNGAGKFTLQPDANSATTTGEITAQLNGLGEISTALASLGVIQVHAAFDGGLADQVARLERLELTTTQNDGRKLIEVTTLQKISFNLTDQRVAFENAKAELARISVNKLPLALAQSIAAPLVIDGGDLSLSLSVEADDDGSHVRVRTVEPVALHDVTLSEGTRKLVDQLAFSVRPSIDYSAEMISAELTDLTASTPGGDSLNGKISAQITHLKTTPSIVFTSHIESKLAGALKPYLPIDIGPLTVLETIEGKFEGQTLQISKASMAVNRLGDSMLASFEVLQPITANFQTLDVSAAQPDAPAVRLRLGEVPLAWAEAFVPKSKFVGTLAAAAFEVSVRSKDDLSLNALGPLIVRGVGATMDGQEMIRGLDLSVDLSASKKGEAVSYAVNQLEVRQGGSSLVKLHVGGAATPGAKLVASAKGELEIDLGAWARQPALASLGTIAKGELKTSFDATLADTVQAKVTLAVRNLHSQQGNQALGDIDLAIDAAVKTDGSGSVKMPLTLNVGGRSSDLTVDGSFAKTAKAFSFEGKLTSEQLIADDFQAFAALAPSSPSPTPAAKPAAGKQPSSAPESPAVEPVRDTLPFWAGATGRFQIDLTKVQYGADYLISGIHGLAVVNETRLSLDRLEGKLKETPFKTMAAVTFDAALPQPYALDGTVGVTDFDVGEFLHAANPKEPPMLETRVSVDGTLKGNGVNGADLGQNAYGQFDVKGTKGILRALAQKTGGVVGVGAKVLGVFGALKGSDSTVALADLVSQLKEMPFDSFAMHVERGADFNLKLTTLEFLSPSTRLTGTGSIDYQKGVAFGQLPLRIEAQLSGKAHMEVLLNRVKMLNGQRDEKGYSLMNTPFKIAGTVDKPDAGQLWKVLGQVGVGALFR